MKCKDNCKGHDSNVMPKIPKIELEEVEGEGKEEEEENVNEEVL